MPNPPSNPAYLDGLPVIKKIDDTMSIIVIKIKKIHII